MLSSIFKNSRNQNLGYSKIRNYNESYFNEMYEIIRKFRFINTNYSIEIKISCLLLFFITQNLKNQKTILISLNNLNINKSNTKRPKSEQNHLSLQSEMSLNKNSI